jgi:ribonuclease Z
MKVDASLAQLPNWSSAYSALSSWLSANVPAATASSPAEVPKEDSDPPLGTFLAFQVIFLGTGAAVPSKYRNVSSTYVQFGSGERFHGVLLDAGEGTLGQLLRRFGPQVDNVRLSDSR